MTDIAVERVALSYRGMHTKVQREKGAAVEHRCVDCSKCAAEWSFIGNLATALWSTKTGRRGESRIRPYSLRVEDYVPRCKRCHRRFDHREVGARRRAEALAAAGQLTLNGLAPIAVAVAV